MTTNAEMELASEAILKHRAGKYKTIKAAQQALGANSQIIEQMLSAQMQQPEPVVDTARADICNSCDKNVNDICMVCACPMNHLLSNLNAVCPEGKW